MFMNTILFNTKNIAFIGTTELVNFGGQTNVDLAYTTPVTTTRRVVDC